MYRLLTFLLATSAFVGCRDNRGTTGPMPPPTTAPPPAAASDDSNRSAGANVTSELTTDQTDFGTKWRAASAEGRRSMTDLAKIYSLFQGATKAQIKKALGEAAETGINKFGDDVMRYELGDVQASDGGGKYHLTFVFEKDVVVNVMGNSIAISP